MADRKDHITNSKDYQKYLDDKMTPKERHEFEKQLLNDDFESEAMEGLSQQNPAEINTDLDALKSKLHKRTKKGENHVYWRIAAALLLLGVFSFVVYFAIDFNPTNEVAQSKKTPATEETEISEETAIPDSTKEPEAPVIAYQQEIIKEGKAEEPSQLILDAREPAVDEEDAERIDIADAAEKIEEDEIGVEPARTEIEELSFEQETEAAIVEEQKFTEAVPQAEIMTAAPAAAKKLESTTAGQRKSARSGSTKMITGNVSSTEDDEGVPGVNVIIKGSNNGAVTDIDGNFSLEIPSESNVALEIASVGYMPEEVVVEDQSEINVKIDPDVTALSEIIVVGYGTAVNNEKADYSYTPPRPVGGNGEFKDYIYENIQYPAFGLEEKIKGTVKLKFTVGTDGQVSNIVVLKSLGDDFDKEAIRLVIEGPTWEPAKENEKIVARDVKVKIRFRPPE